MTKNTLSTTTTILSGGGMRRTVSIATLRQAARAKCLDCAGGAPSEVKKCPIDDCPLHPWRFGRNPFRARRHLSAEQKKACSERLAESRLKRKPK